MVAPNQGVNASGGLVLANGGRGPRRRVTPVVRLEEMQMAVRIVSIQDTAPTERTPPFGRYSLVIEADGVPHNFFYTVELPSSGGQSVSWQPARSFLSDPAVPIMVVASITDAVVRYHQGDLVDVPLEVLPRELGPDTVVIRL
jgi:hypothetical protein